MSLSGVLIVVGVIFIVFCLILCWAIFGTSSNADDVTSQIYQNEIRKLNQTH